MSPLRVSIITPMLLVRTCLQVGYYMSPMLLPEGKFAGTATAAINKTGLTQCIFLAYGGTNEP
jgi:hypothetical protein